MGRKSKWTFKCVFQLKKLCDKKTLRSMKAFDRLILYINIPTIKVEELRMIECFPRLGILIIN